MDKWIARIVTAVLVILTIIFAIFGKAGDMSDTIWAKTKPPGFSVHQIALERAEEEIRAMEREKARVEWVRSYESPEPEKQVTQNRKEAVAIAIAKIVYAEAWIEGEYGWRLVADVLLNRIDSQRFPNDIWGVITQKNQFETYSNGNYQRAPVKEEILEVVYQEMARRTNEEVLFFTAGGYNPYCIPMFRYKHHYFGR